MQSSSQTGKPKKQRIVTQEQICIKNEYQNPYLFQEVQDTLIEFSQTLKKINLPGNNIWLESKYLQLRYNELVQLNLSGNNIKEVSILYMPKIKHIDCSRNILDQFVVKKELINLEILYLNANKLTNFPPLIAPNLTQLNLSHNSIQSIKQFSKKQYPLLQTLTLNNNQLRQTFPRLKCPKLQNLDISSNIAINSIDKFCSDEYLNMKSFILKGIDWNGYREEQFFTKLPLLKMPKLETLIITHAHLKDLVDFSKGNYPELATLQISSNAIELILPRIKLPKLKNVNLNNSMITNITDFITGNYPLLEKIKITGNNFKLYKSIQVQKKILKNQNQIQDYELVHNKNKQVQVYVMAQSEDQADQFIKIQGFSYKFYKDLLTPYFRSLTQIKINIEATRSIQWLFQLDIRFIKNIEISQNHFLTSTYKQLTKININDPYLKNLKNIGIDEGEIRNFVNIFDSQRYPNYRQHYCDVNIERSEYWRRVVSDNKQINWSMNNTAGNGQSYSYETFTGFEQRLFPVRFRLSG